MRFLTNDDIERLVTPADALAAVRSAFLEVAAGRAATQRRQRTAVGDTKLSTLGAVLPAAGVLGAKAYSTVGGRFAFLVVLFAAEDGRRLAVMESDALTRLRTGATSALAAQLLARPDVRRLVVFGTGTQALGHVEAFRSAFEIDDVVLVSRSPRTELPATGVRVTADGVAALAGADVVVTATRATEPLFQSALLPPGAHVSAVGVSRPEVRELDEGAYARAATVAVEWRPQAREEAGGLVHAVAAGVLGWSDVVELADLVAGRVSGRRSPADLTMFQSVGVGLEDIAVAGIAWQRAMADGAGIVLGSNADSVVPSPAAGPLGGLCGGPE